MVEYLKIIVVAAKFDQTNAIAQIWMEYCFPNVLNWIYLAVKFELFV